MRQPRNLLIDSLRGVCILTVVCTHGLFSWTGAPPWMSALTKGYFAVAVFFVISGFLIMGNTLKRYGQPASVDFGEFYAMRVARIMPCLLLFVILMVFAGYKLHAFQIADKYALWGAAYAALTFQFNTRYATANVAGLFHWAPLWSLSVEEIFYVAFPLACFLTRKRWVLILLLLVLVFSGHWGREYCGILSFWGAADLLAGGCLAAIIADAAGGWLQRNAWTWWVLLFTGAALAVYIFTMVKLQDHIFWTPTVLGLGAALFLIGASATSGGKMFAPVAAFGRCSYEVYIFHMALLIVLTEPVLSRLRPHHFSNVTTWLLASAILFVLIWTTCYLLSRFFTEPLNRVIRNSYRTSVE